MNEFGSGFAAWLADVSLLGTALLAVSCLALVLFRHPAARMALARGTLLGLATLCVLTALPQWPRQSFDEIFSNRLPEMENVAASSTDSRAGGAYPAPWIVDAPPVVAEIPSTSGVVSPSISITKLNGLLPFCWLIAAAGALAYICLGGWRAFFLLRTAVKAPAWSQRELESLVASKIRLPRLKTSDQIATAAALVAWRPNILLATQSVREENRAAVRAALAHEWAHIRHGDLWLLALERLLLPVFCLHPLFWLLRRQIRIDQELLADSAAAGDAPVEYAQALLAWAKTESNQAAPSFGIAALSLWEHPSSLSRRVEMLLHAPTVISARGSRLWKWLAPLSLMAIVFGLSLVTLRPAAIAQDNAITDVTVADVQAQPRPEKIKKAKKEKPRKADPKREEVAPDRSPPQLPASNTQIYLQFMVGRVEHAALEKAESSLGDLIQAASEDHCRLEGNLIVAELSAKQFSKLSGELRQASALDILSEPKLITLDGQEARLQIGGQIPLMRMEESIHGARPAYKTDLRQLALEETGKGDPARRVTFQDIGETIVVRPFVSDKNPTQLTLAIEAAHIELDKRAKPGHDLSKVPKFIKHEFSLEVEATVGKTLIITEREPKRGDGRAHSLLLSIVPQKIAPPAPAPVAEVVVPPRPSNLAQMQDEHAALRRQIQDLEKKLNDLEVQIRWMREAAAPGGGKEKVSDEVFIRRVYLDLAGLVPTVEEAKSFLSDKDPQKRDKLIDKLLERKIFRDPAEATKWKDAFKSQPGPSASSTRPAQPTISGEADILQVVRLKRVSADEAAKKLTALFQLASEKPTIVAEERTNSLLLRGSPKALKSAITMLGVLDEEPVPSSAQSPLQPKTSENLSQEPKQLDPLQAEAALQSAKGQYERELNELVWSRLGVKLAVMNEGDFKQLKSKYHGGLKVLEVHTRGPAREEGIRPGDVLVGLHHWETISLENIAFVLKREEVASGEPIAFYLLRGSEILHGHLRVARKDVK